MRRIIVVLAVLVGLSFDVCTAFATQMYYTFEGEVFYDRWDTYGLLAEKGITNGFQVSYTFYIDTERQGIEWDDNEDNIRSEYQDRLNNDGFFAKLITEPYLIYDWYTPDYGTQSGGNHTLDYLNNSERASMSDFSRQGSGDDYVMDQRVTIIGYVMSENGFIEDWELGTLVEGQEWMRAPGENQYSGFAANLTLTAIEYVNPVPEPTTIALFSFGLLGFSGVSRKRS